MTTSILFCLGTWESGTSLVPLPVVHIAHAAHDCPKLNHTSRTTHGFILSVSLVSCAALPISNENVGAVIGRSPQLERDNDHLSIFCSLFSLSFLLPAYMKENAQSPVCQLQALHCLQQLTESHGLFFVVPFQCQLFTTSSPLSLSLLFMRTLLQTTP